jgi:four helix bundle protein
MRFLAHDCTLQLIVGLRPTLEPLRRRSSTMRKQLEDALASIAQNLAEGSGRSGGDRPHLFRIALGSLREVGSILEVAVAFGWLADAPLAAERDRLGGLIYGLQRR